MIFDDEKKKKKIEVNKTINYYTNDVTIKKNQRFHPQGNLINSTIIITTLVIKIFLLLCVTYYFLIITNSCETSQGMCDNVFVSSIFFP